MPTTVFGPPCKRRMSHVFFKETANTAFSLKNIAITFNIHWLYYYTAHIIKQNHKNRLNANR